MTKEKVILIAGLFTRQYFYSVISNKFNRSLVILKEN